MSVCYVDRLKLACICSWFSNRRFLNSLQNELNFSFSFPIVNWLVRIYTYTCLRIRSRVVADCANAHISMYSYKYLRTNARHKRTSWKGKTRKHTRTQREILIKTRTYAHMIQEDNFYSNRDNMFGEDTILFILAVPHVWIPHEPTIMSFWVPSNQIMEMPSSLNAMPCLPPSLVLWSGCYFSRSGCYFVPSTVVKWRARLIVRCAYEESLVFSTPSNISTCCQPYHVFLAFPMLRYGDVVGLPYQSILYLHSIQKCLRLRCRRRLFT